MQPDPVDPLASVNPTRVNAPNHATNEITDRQLLEQWLDGLSPHTQRAYRRGADKFVAFVGKPLREVALGDVQGFAAELRKTSLAPASRNLILSSIKSLFAFGTGIGALPIDAARRLRLKAVKDALSERILDEDEVRRMIAAEPSARNKLILQLLYVAGVRVSELVSLKWRDTSSSRGGGQITVFGKGNKTRTIRLESAIWDPLIETQGDASADAPVFLSRRRGHLHPSQVLRIVKAAADRAGIKKPVSPHWLRHCHASHALDHGAPIHLVQQTLGHSSIATTSRYLHARPNESSSKFLPSVS